MHNTTTLVASMDSTTSQYMHTSCCVCLHRQYKHTVRTLHRSQRYHGIQARVQYVSHTLTLARLTDCTRVLSIATVCTHTRLVLIICIYVHNSQQYYSMIVFINVVYVCCMHNIYDTRESICILRASQYIIMFVVIYERITHIMHSSYAPRTRVRMPTNRSYNNYTPRITNMHTSQRSSTGYFIRIRCKIQEEFGRLITPIILCKFDF